MLRRVVVLVALSIPLGCGSSPETAGEPTPDASTEVGEDAALDAAADAEDPQDANADADARTDADAGPTKCPCFHGDGPYCEGRASAEAKKRGCVIPGIDKWANDLLHCEDGVWRRGEECPATCKYTATSTKLDDDCELPVCTCFVKAAWCGASAGTKAASMNCRVPLLPAHNDDLLGCNADGKWIVKEECAKGCQANAEGTPDTCKSAAAYELPFDCGRTVTCSNGNSTSLHDGKDEYAYDFPAPVGTNVRAMRAGTVLRVRNVSKPGDPCYGGGGSACANLANTVEIKHSDGSVALYMHLSVGTAKVGDTVAQGEVIGKSGNSGWSTGPHLHVQVQSNCGIWWCQSVPFKFAEGPISTGTKVTSKNCP